MNNMDVSHMSHQAKMQAAKMAEKAKSTTLKLAGQAGIPTSMPASNKEWQRVVLWSFWGVNMIIDIVYIGMSFATSTRLSKHIDVKFNVNYNTWRAPIAATVLGPLMVLVFNIMSCVILIRKSVNRSGPSFGYGFIMAWSFMMAFYCLLCGLILDSFSTDALSPSVSGNATDITGKPIATSSSWTAYYSQVYHGTVILNYICCGLFLIFFLAFVVFQGGISKHLNMYDAKTDRKRRPGHGHGRAGRSAVRQPERLRRARRVRRQHGVCALRSGSIPIQRRKRWHSQHYFVVPGGSSPLRAWSSFSRNGLF